MKVVLIILIITTQAMKAADLVVEWPLDLRNPAMYISPPIDLYCFSNKTIYLISGVQVEGEGPRRERYKLPREIIGRCALSLGSGVGSTNIAGLNEISVIDADSTLMVKLPGTSASFKFSVPRDGNSDWEKDLHLFRLGDNGLPVPCFAFTA